MTAASPLPLPLLNLDAGELLSETEALWSLFDIVNIACDGHAGDAASMARLIAFCAGGRPAAAATAPAVRPRAGAHPSYPDRANFGRVSIAITESALAASIADQCTALAAIARAHGVVLSSMKPHGALYHDAAAREPLARAVLEGARAALGDTFTVIGPPHGALREVAAALGLPYAREGFADRALRPDGTLVPRSQPGALITDPSLAAAQALHLARTGAYDTLCVHGDTPDSLAIVRAVRAALAIS